MTSKDMLEIERLPDTPEERQRKLQAFDKSVRAAQRPATWERPEPTFRITIHKRPPESHEMGVTVDDISWHKKKGER